MAAMAAMAAMATEWPPGGRRMAAKWPPEIAARGYQHRNMLRKRQKRAAVIPGDVHQRLPMAAMAAMAAKWPPMAAGAAKWPPDGRHGRQKWPPASMAANGRHGRQMAANGRQAGV